MKAAAVAAEVAVAGHSAGPPWRPGDAVAVRGRVPGRWDPGRWGRVAGLLCRAASLAAVIKASPAVTHARQHAGGTARAHTPRSPRTRARAPRPTRTGATRAEPPRGAAALASLSDAFVVSETLLLRCPAFQSLTCSAPTLAEAHHLPYRCAGGTHDVPDAADTTAPYSYTFVQRIYSERSVRARYYHQLCPEVAQFRKNRQAKGKRM